MIRLAESEHDAGRLPEIPTLVLRSGQTGAGRIDFADVPLVDARLRARSLRSERVVLPAERLTGQELAGVAGRAVWARHAGANVRHDVVAGQLTELQDGETLREKVSVRSPFPALALVDFLREVSADLLFTPPPLRAAFIIDDPNLQRDSYGFITSFTGLVEHARTHAYHVAMAMVPLDAGRARPAALELFAQNRRHVSLTMHGNNHTKRELARSMPTDERLALLAQALNRVASFEQRTGIDVARIMVPPHGAASEEALHDMLRLGYEGAAISRPYPWLDRPPAERPLTSWWPADVATGFPVLGRYHLERPRDEIALRAFLDQPLLLYGHHGDVGSGFEVLAAAAADINQMGGVAWGPLDGIARTNFARRREGDVLRVRLHSRRVAIEVPEGVDTLRVELPPDYGATELEAVTCARAGDAPLSCDTSQAAEGIGVSQGTVEVRLLQESRLDPHRIHPPSRRLWPRLRRGVTESRDRLAPYVRTAVRR
ncbi:MAG: hypothetical protein M3R37_01905 [Actinomycetota bacterium]|nr:hypothetical protein [Actinomycetota bacterium]